MILYELRQLVELNLVDHIGEGLYEVKDGQRIMYDNYGRFNVLSKPIPITVYQVSDKEIIGYNEYDRYVIDTTTSTPMFTIATTVKVGGAPAA